MNLNFANVFALLVVFDEVRVLGQVGGATETQTAKNSIGSRGVCKAAMSLTLNMLLKDWHQARKNGALFDDTVANSV